MARLTNRYALALLKYAEENDKLENVYAEAMNIASGTAIDKDEAISGEMQAFIEFVLESDVKPVMQRFVEIAREKLGIINTKVISAVPLTEKQMKEIISKLEKKYNKKVEATTEIHPEILGGFLVIVGDLVIDYSIRRLIFEMKSKLYEGVNLG